ncbi:hypothetical protein V6N13_043920 [Hibiscus sabdariffa]
MINLPLAEGLGPYPNAADHDHLFVLLLFSKSKLENNQSSETAFVGTGQPMYVKFEMSAYLLRHLLGHPMFIAFCKQHSFTFIHTIASAIRVTSHVKLHQCSIGQSFDTRHAGELF